MIGLHPEEVKADWKEQLAELRKILEEHQKVVDQLQAASLENVWLVGDEFNHRLKGSAHLAPLAFNWKYVP